MPLEWQPPGEEALRRVEAMGLYPPIKRFGRIRVVGLYEIPMYPEVELLEVIVRRPWWQVNLEEWWPYEPPGWSEEWGNGMADFYLSEDGRELIGSYLDDPPIRQTTRFAIWLQQDAKLPQILFLKHVKLPESRPIPRRLLRLVWLDQ